MLKLLAVHRDGSEKVIRIQPGEPEVLGRRTRVALEDSCVSRQHIKVWVENDCWWVSDLDSTHGTWVNHDPVDRPTPLRVGDEIRLGRMLLVVREADPSQGETAQELDADDTHYPGAEPTRTNDGPKAELNAATPLQADEVIIAPSVSLDESEPYDHRPTWRASDETPSRLDAASAVVFTEPSEDSGHGSRAEEDIDPLADAESEAAGGSSMLTAAAQRDTVAGNFGVIFPQLGRPGGSHHRRASKRSDGGRRHEKWVTWIAIAVASTMALVASTAWLMYPG